MIVSSFLLATPWCFSTRPRFVLNRMIAVAAANALYVVARLFERGHPIAITEDPAFARIITRQRQIYPAIEHRQELFQILSAAANVFSRVKWTPYAETASCTRHQLHQSAGRLLGSPRECGNAILARSPGTPGRGRSENVWHWF